MNKYKSLEKFINENIEHEPTHKHYNESFCNLVLDYVGVKEFSDSDLNFLIDNGYFAMDFIEEKEEVYKC